MVMFVTLERALAEGAARPRAAGPVAISAGRCRDFIGETNPEHHRRRRRPSMDRAERRS
jgi:hypothetical protein